MKKRSASDKATDPLSSWAEGPAKSAIVQFVQSVVEKGGKDYVPPEERIATLGKWGRTEVEPRQLRHELKNKAVFRP